MKKFLFALGSTCLLSSTAWSAMPDMKPVWKLIYEEQYEKAQTEMYQLWFGDHKRYPLVDEIVYYYIINAILHESMGQTYEGKINLNLAVEMMRQSN